MSGGYLVISLDFELMWGVRDHRSKADYGDAVLGVREALPKLLALLKRHRVCVTWAIVGLLFARNRQEMLDFYPNLRPAYRYAHLSPYEAICSQIGVDETSDPWHYGRSLVEQVLQTDGQEIATHTYSHYYCLEEGQTIAAFEADLKSANAIMNTVGIHPSSIVFPRNQMSDAHVQACARHDIRAFRGNPDTYLYRPRTKKDLNPLVRGLRLLDANIPIGNRLSYSTPTLGNDCVNVSASRFFRPYVTSLGSLNNLHVRRVIGEMKEAAESGEIYHLWCHPHNFGRHTTEQLQRFEAILIAYRSLQDVAGMQSITMSGAATLV